MEGTSVGVLVLASVGLRLNKNERSNAGLAVINGELLCAEVGTGLRVAFGIRVGIGIGVDIEGGIAVDTEVGFDVDVGVGVGSGVARDVAFLVGSEVRTGVVGEGVRGGAKPVTRNDI